MGCTGSITDPELSDPAGSAADGSSQVGGSPQAGGTNSPLAEIPASCDPQVTPSPTPLRRLGRIEYQNALRLLLAPAGLQAELDAIDAELAQLPFDGENEHRFTGMDRRVTQRHVDAFYGVANALALRLSSDPTRLRALAGACAGEASLPSSCVSSFIKDFGERVFRRPLTAKEQARYAELAGSGQASGETFRKLVFSFLLAPEFLYHLEIGGLRSKEATLALTSHQIAARLSFLFWGAPPDEALLRDAESGAFDSDAGYASVVARVVDDPRTRATLASFFGEWLGILGFAGFSDTAAFRAFRGGTAADESLHPAMTDELYQLIDHFIWDSPGTYSDLIRSQLAFTRSPALAELYGIAPWNGSGSPPLLPAKERSGLFTRAALLASGNQFTNPIQRGVFLLKQVLCKEISPPSNLPAEALALPEPDPARSTRQRFEAKTSPNECAGCHSVINPLGFAFEAYDALGRYRTQERIFADGGQMLAEVPVSSGADLRLDERVISVSGPVELSQVLADSREAKECLVRQVFRFSYRRHESQADACSLTALLDPVLAGGSLRETLRGIATLPAFRTRVLEAP